MKTTPISKEELNQYRKDTKGCKDVIHFNNAGASLPPEIVVNTVIGYLKEEAIGGGYETEARHIAEIENVYQLIATFINADKEEIAICENASAAWLTAFKGIDLQPGDEIITCELEYVTNLMAFIDARKAGITVAVIDNDEAGNFPLNELEEAISAKTRLIAVTHIPSSGGTVLPIEEIGKIAKKHKILYMVDACQTSGQYPIDVNAIGCDILSATGRKYLRAPRGTGFLYVRKSVQNQIRPLLLDWAATTELTLNDYQLRQDARRYELYEKSRALTLGLGKAVEYAMKVSVGRIWDRVQQLAAYTRDSLRQIPGITVHDTGSLQCGIVTFSVDKMDSLQLKNALVKKGDQCLFRRGGSDADLHEQA